MYYVYSHKNKYNNKQYIGYTECPEDRWEGNGTRYKTCPRFWSAICHYGWDAFSHIILYQTENKQEALQKEQEYIKKYNTINLDYGYNLASGGTGGDVQAGWDEARKRQYSDTCKQELERRIQTTDWKEHLSIAQQKRWEKVKKGELPKPNVPKGGKVHNAKRVRCVETQKEYDCCADAMEDLGCSRSQSSRISRVANGDRHIFHGFHWEYC